MGTLASYLEPALTIGTGAAAQPLSGLWGLINGLDANAVKRAQDALTYQPYTEGGKKKLQSLGGLLADVKDTMVDRNPPVKMALDAYTSANDYVGERSPALGALMAAAPTAAGALVGPGGAATKNVAKGMAENAMAPTALSKQAGVYLVHTPQKPHPLVGSRFEREFVGSMVPKNTVNIDSMKGSSVLVMPWDSTNRGYKITNISDEAIPGGLLSDGGQDFARDLRHFNENIGGASNSGIAKRIQDRVVVAQRENVKHGGNGDVFSFPISMGAKAEDYSTMPTEAVLGLIQNANLSPSDIGHINRLVQTAKNEKGKQAFTGFKGVDTDEGLLQFITGEGINDTAGNLRKAFMDRMRMVDSQKRIGFNIQDLEAALKDPSLEGLPKGYVGNTVIKSDPLGKLTVSDHPSYDTNFPGRYFGSLGTNIPVDVLMPKTFAHMSKVMQGKKGNLRQNVIGALEKRKSGISEIVDQQVIDSVGNYLHGLSRQ